MTRTLSHLLHITSITSLIALSAPTTTGAGLTFNDPTLPGTHAIAITPPASTGLETVYVLEEYTNRMTASFEATGSAPASSVRWSRFSNLGGGFAEDVPSSVEGNRSVISLRFQTDMHQSKGTGYIVEYEGRQHCFWVVNYFQNECRLNGLSIDPQQECDRTALTLDGYAPRIVYYSVNGVAQTLSREMKLTYNSLAYNEERLQYEPVTLTETIDYVDATTIRTTAPLCDTEFNLSADRFQLEWMTHPGYSGWTESVTSPIFHTNAIAAATRAAQTSRDNDNEQREEKTPLGGSGPAEITFTAEVTDAVVFKEWQFSRDSQFDVIDLRIQELEVAHTFRDYGTTYVRFIAGNDTGSCDFIGETYEIYIGESKLDCPNAFSPYGTEGINDEWKVSYKSIIEFDCHIFNRWGQQMAHLTDPSQGWDGRYKGKLVPSGVYYYVIKAKGTDGKDYKLSGDINILKYSNDSERTQ